MLARIRGSGAYQPYIAARSSVVTISSVSSSWLRRKIAHWHAAGMSGVCRKMSVMGKRSSWASAMYMRGISGKWNAIWHSSPSPK